MRATPMTVRSSLDGIARVNGFPRTGIVVMSTAHFVSTRSAGEVRTRVAGHARCPRTLL